MKKLLILLVVVGLGLIGGAYWFHRSAEEGHVDFTTAATEYGTLVDTINATGSVRIEDPAVVVPAVPGKVTAIKGEINQHVHQGDVLVTLQNDEITSRVQQARDAVTAAKAQVEQAQAVVEARQEALDHLKSISADVRPATEVTKARAELRAAKAAQLMANARLQGAQTSAGLAEKAVKELTVRAPISGIIIDKKVLIGQPVGLQAAGLGSAGPRDSGAGGLSVGGLGGSASALGGGSVGPLFTIAPDLGKLNVHAQVMEGDIGKVLPGQDATFTVYAYAEDEKFAGKVKEIRPLPASVQGTAVFYDTIIEAKNRRDKKSGQWLLRPGMTASVDIVRRVHDHVWKMPVAALDFQLDDAYQTPEARNKIHEWQNKPHREDWQAVWVLRDDKPWPIFIRTGGVNAAGENGISDGKFKEVLEWEPDLKPVPDPKVEATWPKAIIAAPPVHKGGLFDQPTKFKFS